MTFRKADDSLSALTDCAEGDGTCVTLHYVLFSNVVDRMLLLILLSLYNIVFLRF
jgi:hypothetical protein